MVVRRSDELWLRVRSLYPGLIKLRPLQQRHFDGVLVSMPQSGTHWVRYMLSLTLARLYNLPPPTYIQSSSIVGNPIYPRFPRIFHSHAVPHYVFRSRTLFRLLHLPRHLVLVRDIRDSLVSHYEKHKGLYKADFSTFLRGDVRGKRYKVDIWQRIQFLNGWGAVAARHPEQVAVLKYEDLLTNTRGQLAWVCDYFNIEGVTPDLIADVVAAASKEEMAKRENPKRKTVKRKPAEVRIDPRPPGEWYGDEDRLFVAEVLRRNLRYTFGYRYW